MATRWPDYYYLSQFMYRLVFGNDKIVKCALAQAKPVPPGQK